MSVVLAVLGLYGCTLPSRTSTSVAGLDAAAADRARRFDRVEQLVRTRYYHEELHGLNWAELCAEYRPQAIAATTEAEWYTAVNGMLRELRDVHTRAQRPDGDTPGAARTPTPTAGAVMRRSEPVAQLREDGLLYLRFDHFDANTARWLQEQVQEHAKSATGIVLDLRNNTGGLVVAAQRCVGLFFPTRVPMGVVVHRNGRRVTEYSKNVRGPKYTGPLAVLVGPNSHSSAEVFAYVMQHHGRAVVVGQTTAGEVLGAKPFRLPDGGQLYVSVTDFRRFEGGQLEGCGVEPDIVVRAPRRIGADPATDPTLTAAVQALQGS